MEILIQALESYGYLGMTIAAFLAGSIFPFSSEAVMVSLQLAGLEPWPLFLSATVGNVVGSVGGSVGGWVGGTVASVVTWVASVAGSAAGAAGAQPQSTRARQRISRIGL
jgi:hypothetical protein